MIFVSRKKVWVLLLLLANAGKSYCHYEAVTITQVNVPVSIVVDGGYYPTSIGTTITKNPISDSVTISFIDFIKGAVRNEYGGQPSDFPPEACEAFGVAVVNLYLHNSCDGSDGYKHFYTDICNYTEQCNPTPNPCSFSNGVGWVQYFMDAKGNELGGDTNYLPAFASIDKIVTAVPDPNNPSQPVSYNVPAMQFGSSSSFFYPEYYDDSLTVYLQGGRNISLPKTTIGRFTRPGEDMSSIDPTSKKEHGNGYYPMYRLGTAGFNMAQLNKALKDHFQTTVPAVPTPSDYATWVEGEGFNEMGAVMLASGSTDSDQSVSFIYTQILQHYYHPAPPFVEDVAVTQSGQEVYYAEWDLDDTTYPNYLRNFNKTDYPDPISPKSDLQIAIDFSEQIDNSAYPPFIRLNNGMDTPITVSGSALTVTQYQFGVPEDLVTTIPVSQLQTLRSGPVTLEIFARHAVVDTWYLNTNPTTICYDGVNDIQNYSGNAPSPNGDGTFSAPASIQPDANHFFVLSSGPFVQSLNMSQGTTVFYSAAWPMTAMGSPPAGPLSVYTNLPI